MKEIWRRIEAQFRLQAPGNLSQLGPGAKAGPIKQLETMVGRPLPDEILQSYAIHDGAYGVPFADGFDRLLSLEDIARELATWRSLLGGGDFHGLEPEPVGPIRRVWWSLAWVPIVGEGTGDHLCVDLDPDEGGTVGQIFDFGHEYGPAAVVFPSFRAYLEQYAADIESGAIRFDAAQDGWVRTGHPAP